jgi:hypothetical protein
MATYLGVDPGLAGALALLDVAPDGTQAVRVWPVPVVTSVAGGRRRRHYDVPAVLGMLKALPATNGPITLAYLEEQGPRPAQDARSTFSTGFGFGLWTALLTSVAIPFVTISPQQWRRRVGLPRQPKGTSRKAIKEGVHIAARRRFPTVAVKLDHADAVMLAVAAALEHRATGDEAGDG